MVRQTTVFRVRLLRLSPGCGVSSWAKGPRGGWLSETCPSLCRPSSLCLFSHTFFFTPFFFPSSLFSVLSLRRLLFLSFPSPPPRPLGRCHTGTGNSPAASRRPGGLTGRWSLECPSSLFWRSPIFGCEEGESENGADSFSWPCVPSSALL